MVFGGAGLWVWVGMGWLVLVYVGVECKELIGVVKGSEKFLLGFFDALCVEFKVFPWVGVGDDVPSDGVWAHFFDEL